MDIVGMNVGGRGSLGDGYLPEELLTEILVRLPVKTLLRCMCVCKCWYAFIRSPSFVTIHYNHPANLSSLIVRHAAVEEKPKDNDKIGSTECALLSRIISHDETLTLTPPPREVVYDGDDIARFRQDTKYDIVGPVDGLFLLHIVSNNRLLIWNPCTTEIKLLPQPEFGSKYAGGGVLHSFGFGLDPLTNTYKVVWIPVKSRYWREAGVYTLSSDSWRRTVIISVLGSNWYVQQGYGSRSDATYLNGCYYWLVNRDCWIHKVLLFDMGNEAFKDIWVPSYCNHINPSTYSIRYDLTLALLDNRSIALLIMENKFNAGWHSENVSLSISVWLLKNQEEEEEDNCWTKLYTFPIKNPPSQYIQHLPLGLWKNNGIFFQINFGRLFLYIINGNHEFIDIGVRTTDSTDCNFLMVFNYKESLASVGGEKKNNWHPVVRELFV